MGSSTSGANRSPRDLRLSDDLLLPVGDTSLRTENRRMQEGTAVQARILVVDDRHSLVWFIERILQQQGFEVVTAFGGAEGLRKAREERPDLVILDTVMPRMDGIEAHRQLQMDGDTSGTPVLFLTMDEKADRKRLEAGKRRKPSLRNRQRPGQEREAVIDFLTKPFTAEEILSGLEALLQARNREAGSRPVTASKPLILIVDDTRSLVRLAERTLQKEGFDVITAHDGLEGLRKARDEKPDLIVLDIVMPELDGVQVLQLIRRHTRTPVIMLTSDHDMDTVRKTITLGADGYLVKPVSTTALVARVKEKLSGAGVPVA